MSYAVIQIACRLTLHIAPKSGWIIKGPCTVTQLIQIAQDLFQSSNRRSHKDEVQLGFLKAFDEGPHVKLINKVSNIVRNTHITDWITVCLPNRTQFTSQY